MNKLKHLVRNICQLIINIFFVGHHFWGIKRCLLRVAGATIGKNVRVVGPIYYTASLIIGSDTFIGRKFEVHGNGKLTIGDKCDIAPEVSILTGSHEIAGHQQRAGKGKSFSISIGDGCWIGGRVTIMGDTTVGNGAIIGACSLVNKTIADDVLAAGVPVRVIRKLE